MKIRFIEFAGIRVYSDNQRVEFGDNINILVGKNRAGKSSLQDALVIGLFGLGKQSERLNRSSVWSWTNPGEFRTLIQYQVNSELYQIERDFIKNRVSLGELVDNETYMELTNDPEKVKQYVSDHTGMENLGLFTSTCCVRQQELSKVSENLSEVGHLIQRVFTGSIKSNAKEIIDILKAKRLDIKASKTTEIRHARKREYDTLEEEREAVVSALKHAKDGFKELSRLTDTVSKLEEEIPGEREQLEEVRYLLVKQEKKGNVQKELQKSAEDLDRVSGQIQRIKVIDESLYRISKRIEALQSIESFKDTIKNEVPNWMASKETFEDKLIRLQNKKKETEEERHKVQIELDRLNSLENCSKYIDQDLPGWEYRSSEIKEEIESTNAEVTRMESTLKHESSRIPSWRKVGGVLLSLAGIVSLFSLHGHVKWIGGLLVLIGVSMFLWALYPIYKNKRLHLARLQILRDGIKRDYAQLKELEERITALIQDARQKDVETLKKEWERCKELKRLKSALDSNLADTEGELLEANKQYEKYEGMFKNILGDTNTNSIGEMRERLNDYEGLIEEKKNREAERQGILGKEGLKELEDKQRILDSRVRQYNLELAESGLISFCPATEEIERWRGVQKELKPKLKDDEHELIRTKERLDTLKDTMQDPVGLEERRIYIEGRLKELDLIYKAYGKAIATFEEAVKELQEEYLPEMEKTANQYFKEIVPEEFDSVQLIKSWPKIILSSKVNDSIPVAGLSLGTIDQLYLSLRIASLELLGKGVTLPLIIDDSFANYDPHCQAKSLRILEELAESRQIIFFSCHPEYLEWGRELKKSRGYPVKLFNWDNSHRIVEID
ncbi:MAG: AAA family ATPase [Desulfobacterales bacterium]|nr:AAA family ATPase [Desulfobacterales bacterium]